MSAFSLSRLTSPCLALASLFAPALLLPAHAQTSTSPLPADATPAQRIIWNEAHQSEVMATLEYLSDMIGPRLTGTERLRRANEWTAERMRSYGLENVHLEPYVIPSTWERGKVEARLLGPQGVTIHAAQKAWTPGTRGKVTGPVVIFTPDTEEELAAFKGKLKGAIVLTSKEGIQRAPWEGEGENKLKPIKPFAAPAIPQTRGGRPANFDFKKFMEFRKKVATFIKEEGAVAVLNGASKPHDLLNMTGSWDTNWGGDPLPTLFVAQEQVSLLHRLSRRGLPLAMDLRIDCKFRKRSTTVYNTVGEIRGSEKPEEVVLLGAHLDSWDLGQGTTDNGTGSSVVLESARLLKSLGKAPKRTVRFVLFSGEEQGLFGSQAYVTAHKADMGKISVVFVHDTGTGRVKGAWLQERTEVKPVLDQEFAGLKSLDLLPDGFEFLPGKMNGTDHASFDDAGVPAFAFYQDGAEYNQTHHSQSDTFDKARPDDLKQGSSVMAILAYNAAQMPEMYPRKTAKTAEK